MLVVDATPVPARERKLVGSDEIPPAQVEPIDAELARGDVDRTLAGERGLHRKRRADRPDGRLGGRPAFREDVERRPAVGAWQLLDGEQGDSPAEWAHVSPQVDHRVGTYRQEPAVGVERERHVHPHFWGVVDRE